MADKKKEWDLTSTHALEGACEWIRKRAGALMVIAIRPGSIDQDGNSLAADSAIAFDAVIDVDPELPANDILARLELEMPALVEKVKARRRLAGDRVREKKATR